MKLGIFKVKKRNNKHSGDEIYLIHPDGRGIIILKYKEPDSYYNTPPSIIIRKNNYIKGEIIDE